MSKINLKNKIIVCTGGTGSLGQVLVRRLLKEGAKKVKVYSRDEFKQSEMARELKNKRITYWLGDVRDLERLRDCCKDADYIFHTAAAKRMDQTSINTFEISDINIRGTYNVMIAGQHCKRIIFVSSDKSFKPSCSYGNSKAIAEKIALAYKNSIVWRFCNFLDSRGSVFQIFNEQKKKCILTVCNKTATRFVIKMEKACSYLLSTTKHGLFFPKNLKSIRIIDLAKKIAPKARYKYVGLREGEKDFEEFNEEYNSKKYYDKGKRYIW